MVKAVIFDFDGVIHDTWELSYSISEKIHDNLTPEDHKNLFNGNIYTNRIITPEKAEEFFALQKNRYDDLKIQEHIKKGLAALQETCTLFIVSSNEEETLHTYLKNNNISQLFEEILGRETHQSKDEKFRMLFQRHNLTTDNCIFITDTLGDILEANKLGIKTIAVDFGYHERERLEKGNPLKVVSQFSDIVHTIDELKKGRTTDE